MENGELPSLFSFFSVEFRGMVLNKHYKRENPKNYFLMIVSAPC